jgi:pilus assembly protein CpaE
MNELQTLNADAPRLTVALGLPERERDAIASAFREAGFGTYLVDRPEDLLQLVGGDPAIAVGIFDVSKDPDTVTLVAAELRRRDTPVPMVYIATDETLDALATGMISPADEILLRPLDFDALRWRVEAMTIRAQAEPLRDEASDTVLRTGRVDAEWAPRAPIFAVFNPKGGVGKTTIATNLAAALQLRKDRQVLLVDADTVTGHVVMSLGMETGRTVADSWDDELEGDEHEPILNLAAVHTSGVRVAALTSSPLNLPNLDPERVVDTLLEARESVDAIIIDLHPSYSELNLAIFAIADRILVPVTPDLPAIRAAVQLAEVASQLGVRDRLAMVVNRANSGVSVDDIEKTTGFPCLAEIRSAGLLLVSAANTGKTLIDKYPREKVTDDFDHLAERLLLVTGMVEPQIARTRRFGLGGVFGRKASATA